jgi:LuxR family maltose regulon positive regulatory protein
MPDWPPVVERKLARPRMREGVIVRPRVQRRFDNAAPLALVLVSAPAGYGKTMAVATWMNRRRGGVAWVTADARDDDPVRLWTHVAVAVERELPGAGSRALAELASASASVEPALDALAAGIGRVDAPLAIVFDDFHAVTDERCLRTVDYALGVLPDNARVVIVTRTDPKLRIGRRRAEGSLCEVRARRLAFTPPEARRMLVDNEGLDLDDGQVATLAARTEGWPAGLYLAALWLRRAPDVGRAVAEFAGTERAVADYFASEVLPGLEADVRAFLISTSVLEAFDAELCDVLLDRGDSYSMLTRIERSNLFLIALEQLGWYRYHDLFRDLLLAELDRREARTLHRRAAAWLASREMVEEAVEQLYAAGDDEAVADVLEAHHLELARQGRATTIVRWLSRVPDAVLQERPSLIVAGAVAATLIARPAEEIRRLLAAAERARRVHPDTWTPYHAAAVQLMRAFYTEQDVGAAVAAAEEAVQLARAGENVGAPATNGAGKTNGAAKPGAAATPGRFTAPGAPGRLAAAGDIAARENVATAGGAAEGTGRFSAPSGASSPGGIASPDDVLAPAAASAVLISALATLAGARLLSGDLDAAAEAALEAVGHPDADRDPHGLTSAETTLALVALAQGRRQLAAQRVEEALKLVRQAGIKDSPSAGAAELAAALIARADGRLGDAERAAERAAAIRGSLGGARQAWMQLTLAGIRVDRGRLVAAVPALELARELLAGCKDAGVVGDLLPSVEQELATARERSAPIAEPPSPAELEVLKRLPGGESIREISASLFLSVNTIKTHLRSLYRKLGVSSREQAVARAYALGLIDDDSAA